MSAAWTTVALIGVATVAIKASGPLLAGGRGLPGPLAGVVQLLAPVLLAALVATQALAGDGRLVLDERAAGVAAAGVVVALRAPVLAAVAVAALVTALLRLAG